MQLQVTMTRRSAFDTARTVVPARPTLRKPLSVSAFTDSTPQPSKAVKRTATPKTPKAPAAPKVAKTPKTTEPSKKPKKTADPDHIKRAPSAYNLYFKDALPSVKAKAAPGVGVTTLTKTVSEMWKDLPEAQKKPYEEEAARLKAEVAAKRGDADEEKKKNAKPTGVYASFMKANFSKFKAQNPSLAAPDVLKVVAEAWKKVDQAEKDAMQAEYKAQLAAWKAAHPDQ